MRPRKLAYRIALIGGALWSTGLWGGGAQACDFGCGSCYGYNAYGAYGYNGYGYNGYGYNGYGYNAAAYTYGDDDYGYADPEYANYAYAPVIYNAPPSYYQPAPMLYYGAPAARPVYTAPLGYGPSYAPYVRGGPYWGGYTGPARTANLGPAKDRAAGAMMRVARPIGPRPLPPPPTRIAAPPAGPVSNAPLGYGRAPYVRGPTWKEPSNPPRTANLGVAKDRAAGAILRLARPLGPAPNLRAAAHVATPPGPVYAHVPSVRGPSWGGSSNPPRTANVGSARDKAAGAPSGAARAPARTFGSTAPPPRRSINPAPVGQQGKPVVQMRATAPVRTAPGAGFTTRMALNGQAMQPPAPAHHAELKAQRNTPR
jgi:hypothetical protein